MQSIRLGFDVTMANKYDGLTFTARLSARLLGVAPAGRLPVVRGFSSQVAKSFFSVLEATAGNELA